MPWLRRREPLHRRLAREAGLTPEPQPHDPGPHWGEVGIHGIHRQRDWDALVAVAAEIAGDEVRFVTLADGSVVIEAGEDDADPSPLADALEGQVEPPYRAAAVRHDDLWTVGARRIEVIELDPDPGGEELELSWNDGERAIRVDGEPTLGSVPALERIASERHDAWVVRASRLDGPLWEYSVAPL